MKNAIQKAYEGGYRPEKLNRTLEWEKDMGGMTEEYQIDARKCQLDPEFWRCLGKAMGWGKSKLMRPAISNFRCAKCGADEKDIEMQMDEVKYHQYRFIDHLASNGNADDFFNELLK